MYLGEVPNSNLNDINKQNVITTTVMAACHMTDKMAFEWLYIHSNRVPLIHFELFRDFRSKFGN